MNTRKIKFKEYKSQISNICREIQFCNWRPDYIVGITGGGLVAAVMISKWFGLPCETLNICPSNSIGESKPWMAIDAFGKSESDQAVKNILVVNDINNQGSTFNWLMSDWKSSCMPADPRWQHVWNNNVRFAVVIDNLASECEVKMDFCGQEINKVEQDTWVEFPYEEWWK